MARKGNMFASPAGMKYAVFLCILIAATNSEARVARRRTPSAPMRFEATAFSTYGTTQKGTVTHDGVVAADPAVLPLGSVIQVTEAGARSGRYVVTDTGSKIVGRHIDLYIPDTAEAKEFGKKVVTVRLIVKGNNEKNDHAEVTPAAPHQAVPAVPVGAAAK